VPPRQDSQGARRRTRGVWRAGDSRRAGGFTLLELLIALVIAGVLVGVATLSIGGFDRSLRFEAERLAQLLLLAREESLVRGAPIRLEADDERYRFAILRDRRWQPILDDRDLRERTWQRPTRLTLVRPDGRTGIEFGRDQIDAPFELHVQRDGEQATIYSNGLGTFEMR
jgi:general secretion pathway protein H